MSDPSSHRVTAPLRATAQAPASIGNLGVGFDVLGLAAPVAFDRVTVTHRAGEAGGGAEDGRPEVRIRSVAGIGADAVPREAEANTAGAAVLAYVEEQGLGGLWEIEIDKGIPVAAGLGGSAASAVAAVVAANALAPEPLPIPELYPYALAGEAVASGAYNGDNVAPSLLGGMTLILDGDAPEQIELSGGVPTLLLPLPVPSGIHVSLVRPHLRIETHAARALLPGSVPLSLHSRQSGLLAAFTAACLWDDAVLVARTLADHIAEPHRSALVPGFEEARQAAWDAGALAFTLSGSGPAVFAWSEGQTAAEEVTAAIRDAFAEAGHDCDAWTFDTEHLPGAELLESPSEAPS